MNDRDREAAVELAQRAYAAGDLTVGEMEEQITLALVGDTRCLFVSPFDMPTMTKVPR